MASTSELNSDDDELSLLLMDAENEINTESNQVNSTANSSSVTHAETSVVHTSVDPLDSSDDEDVSNYLNRKYNEYGRDIKSVLKKQNDDKIERKIVSEVKQSIRQDATNAQPTPHVFPSYTAPAVQTAPKHKPMPVSDPYANIGVYTDPVFGIRIVHPLVSSNLLQERMSGRKAIPVCSLKNHVEHGNLKDDWALAGVIVHKGSIMTSKKGHQYTIWKLSDLKNDIKMVSVFLFQNAYKDLWKTAQGMVVAILNPNTMDNNSGKSGDVCLSVDNSQKCMILGQSKDLGVCKSRKKNGDPCTAIVNKHTCEYCVYHVQQEYSKMSGRSELQSTSSGRGLQDLRNKVLGKNEVFYGGQSFQAVPAKKNPKLSAKDNNRLMTLSEYYQSPNASTNSTATNTTITTNRPYASANTRPTVKTATGIDANVQQRQKDLQRLEKLTSHPSNGTETDTIEPLKNRQLSCSQRPTLKKEGFSLDFSPQSIHKSDLAKHKARAILQKNPIAKSNPNFIKYRGTETGKKRALEDMQSRDGDQVKKAKITEAAEKFQSERIKAMINAKSAHTDLIEAHQNDAQDVYFNKLEKKEAMEEKMLNTFQMACKAVVCLTCKYTAFSAADRCKEARHPLKVIDAQKRFFECQDCGSRTITVHRMPQTSCKNCQSSRWKRAAMIKEKKTTNVGEHLSIRGDEETFLGSLQTNGNLNLCVADD